MQGEPYNASMILGYNTNGFAHHRLVDAIAILSELGYRGLALTPDVNHLNPFQKDHLLKRRLSKLGDILAAKRLDCAIETGARFVLDPFHKHQPTLISPSAEERYRRLAFLQRGLVIAKKLGSRVLSFWSGKATDDATHRALMARLVDGCRRLVDATEKKGVRLAFEPEPGMFIDTMDKFEELHAKVNHPHFGLTLDVGHLVCTGELPVGDIIRKWKKWLWNVHLDDMRPGVHDHLMFGEGTVDFADVFSALREVNFKGIASVELSRHSYDAVNVARRAKAFLDRL